MGHYLSLELTPLRLRAWLFDDRAGSFELRGHLAEAYEPGQDLLALAEETVAQIKPPSAQILGTGLSLSAGKPIRTVLVGASATHSLRAARALAAPFYTEIVDEIDLQDGLSVVQQLERFLRTDADLFIISGGTEGGAEKPILTALDNLGVMLKAQNRAIPPQIVYAGNTALHSEIEKKYAGNPNFHIGGNILSSLDSPNSAPALQAMLEAFRRIRRAELPGLKKLEGLLHAALIPSLLAIRRTLDFLGKSNKTGRPVLSLHLEPWLAAATVGYKTGESHLLTHPWSYEPKEGDQPERFNSQLLEKNANREYLLNKALHPQFLPLTVEDAVIEQSWFRLALRDCCRTWRSAGYFAEDFYPEPILLSGDNLGIFGRDGQLLLSVMDGLELQGITTYVFDEFKLSLALGSLASLNPLLVVQVLKSGLLQNLGTVLTVLSPKKAGQEVLAMELQHKFGALMDRFSVLKSELKRFEIEANDEQKIVLLPQAETDLGLGAPGVGGSLNRINKKTGLIVDARGRPIEMPKDDRARAAVIANWLADLGA